MRGDAERRGDLALLERALGSLGGKWNPRILCLLGERGTLRYGELRDALGISDAVLSPTLRALCAERLVQRIEYPGVPPRVEYSLTAKGSGALPLLRDVIAWAEGYEWTDGDGGKPLRACDFHSPV